MTDTNEDPILNRVVSESAYDQAQLVQFALVDPSVSRTLLAQALMAGLLAALAPMYLLFPEGTATLLGTDPLAASPKPVVLGGVGLAIQVGTATLLVATVRYRRANTPLTEAQAHHVVGLERVATHVGLVTGGVAVAAAVATSALGLGGKPMLDQYVATLGGNPLGPSGTGVSVAALAAVSLLASLLLLALWRLVDN